MEFFATHTIDEAPRFEYYHDGRIDFGYKRMADGSVELKKYLYGPDKTTTDYLTEIWKDGNRLSVHETGRTDGAASGTVGLIGRSATEEEATGLIARMEAGAEIAPEVELTPENWSAQFGEDGEVDTPIGKVKMGEGQYLKLARQGRDGKLGMIRPTLETPDVIIEDKSQAKDGQETERPYSYVFVKAFTGENGERKYLFTSVTVQKDGREVSISSQEKSENRISNLLQQGKIGWINEKHQSVSETQNGKSVSLDDSRTATQADNDTAPLGINSSNVSADKGTQVSEENKVRLPENPVASKWAALVEANEGDEAEALDTAVQMVGNKTAELELARKTVTKGKTEEAIQEAKRVKREKVSALETELQFWKDVAGYPEKKRASEAQAAELNARLERERKRREQQASNPNYGLRQTEADDRLGAPLSLREYVIRKIATGRVKFLWSGSESGTGGLKEHGGAAKRQMLYTDKTRGQYPEDVAEAMRLDIADNYPEFGQVEASDILSEIENLSVGEQTPSEMMEEAERLHERSRRAGTDTEAEEAAREEAAIEEARAEQARASVAELTPEEYSAVHHAAPRFAGDMFDETGRPKAEADEAMDEALAVVEAEAQVDTNPTDGQKEAGNYRKGHVRVNGLDITIENPKGSVRSGVDGGGKPWRTVMHNTYGYIRGTEGVDGDHIDVFLSDNPYSGEVFVVDQVNPQTGAFDEHKVMMGFDSEEAAREAYLSNYSDGWQGLGNITRVSQEDFRKWLDSSHRKTKPFAEYKIAGVGEAVPFQRVSGADVSPLATERQAKAIAKQLKKLGLKGEVRIVDGVAELVKEARARLQSVFHGSGADFEAFDFSHMGSGEGAQAYGWGGYVTEVEGIGRTYANNLSSRFGIIYNGDKESLREGLSMPYVVEDVINDVIGMMKSTGASFEEAADRARKYWQNSFEPSHPQKRKVLSRLRAEDFDRHRNLYHVEIPTEQDGNYLTTGTTVPKSSRRKIADVVRGMSDQELQRDKHGPNWLTGGVESLANVIENGQYDAQDIRKRLVDAFGSEKRASEIMSEAGFVGISYPAQYQSGGRADNARNYVIFKESDMKITDHIRYEQDASGEIAGATLPNGDVLLNRQAMRIDTPFHEFAHKLFTYAKGNRAAGRLYEVIRRYAQEAPQAVKDYVGARYPDLKDDAYLDEVFAWALSRQSEGGLEAFLKERGIVADDTASRTWYERVWDAVKSLWAEVRPKVSRLLGRDFADLSVFDAYDEMGAEETGKALYDLMMGGKRLPDAEKAAEGTDARAQMGSADEAEIERKAKADGTWLKAPNGKPTKLTPGQWVQVRTKAFKDWFGDWEKATRIEKLRNSKSIEITGNEIEASEDLKQYKKNALDYGKAFRGEYKNNDTGSRISVNAASIKEVLHHDVGDIAHIQSVAAIPAIVENGIYIDTVTNEDTEKNPKVREYQYYVVGLKIGDVDYTVKSVIAVDNNGNRYYDHALTKIEKGNLLNELGGITSPASQKANSLSDIKDKRLLSILQTNSSKVVDENGEPLVVYHGTGAEFTVFDKRKIRRRSDGIRGFYFAPPARRMSVAGYYGADGNAKGFYLSIKTPLVIPTNIRIDRSDIQGHDGIIRIAAADFASDFYNYETHGIETETLKKGDIVEIIALEPTQIKSATDNVGTFDAGNPDIRYRFAGDMFAEDGRAENDDAAYLSAVERGDMETAQQMVNEAAARAGYNAPSDYQGSLAFNGAAPSKNGYFDTKEERKAAWEKGEYEGEMSLGDFMDIDIDTHDLGWHLTDPAAKRNAPEYTRESIDNLSSTVKSGKRTIKMYRAVDASVKENSFRNGDWITPSRKYAQYHIGLQDWKEGRVIEREVSVDDIWWDGDDINEWGYDDGKDYGYRNTENNRKSLDAVTRDDAGNIIPLSKRFDQKKSDARYRFIGEKGAANLDKAEEATTRLDNLAVAREMEEAGKDAKTVKMATGWERGADGKWRYEVQDFEIDARGLARKGRLWQKLTWGEEFDRLSLKLLDGKELTMEEASRFDELSDKADEMRKSYEASDVRYLDDYVKDSDLFEAYPDLKHMRIEIYSEPNSNTGATYYAGKNLIRINEQALEAESLRGILSHEVQHAIQAIEGFARGGNDSTYKMHLDSLKEKHDAWSMTKEFTIKRDELGQEALPIDVYNAVRDEYLSLGFEFGDDGFVSRDAFDKGFNIWVRGYDKEGYEDAYNEYQSLAGKFGLGLGNDRYRELAGEVEARNVQGRMDMTPEERRASLASETEDVAREDQLFIGDALGVPASMAERAEAAAKTSLEAKRQAALDAGASLGVPIVVEEAPAGGRRRAKDEALGWFDVRTGAVHVNPGNHADAEDVKRTVMHEAVGHMGMRRLLEGKHPGAYDAFLDRVHAAMPAEAQAYFLDYARRSQAGRPLTEAELKRIAADEYVAALAEVGGDPNVWQRVVAEVRALLRRIGFDIDLSEADIRALLYESKHNLESAAYYAEREMMRREQKEYRDEANLSNRLDEDADVLYRMRRAGTSRDGRLGVISLNENAEEYDRNTAQGLYRQAVAFGEWVVDTRLRVRSMMTHLKRLPGAVVSAATDLWNLQPTIVSKKQYEIKKYNDAIGEPLLRILRGLYRNTKGLEKKYFDTEKIGGKNSMYYLSLYLIAKHIPERNAWMAAKKNDGQGDYAGTTEFKTLFDMTPEEYAAQYEKMVADAGLDGDLAEMWRLINASTEFALRKRVEYGLLSKESYDAIKAIGYRYYVPLKGHNRENPDSERYLFVDYPDLAERAHSAKAKIHGAKGRKSIADDPLPYILRDVEMVIDAGETNRFRQALAKLRDDNKNLTYIFGSAAAKKELLRHPDGGVADELKETGVEIDSHFVNYYENGEQKAVYMVNPRLAAALRGDADRKGLPRLKPINVLRMWTRFMAEMNTAMSPVFAITNLMRDLQFATISRYVESDDPIKGIAASAAFLYEFLRAIPAAVAASAPDGIVKGNFFRTDIIEAWRKNGGETGWHTLNDLRETKERLYKEITRSPLRNAWRVTWKAMPVAFRFLTEVSENSVRLAAFSDAKRRGMSDQAAAYYSKEVTTNFNRSSRAAMYAGPLYAFFNAQTQGIYRFLNLMKENPGNAATVAVGMFAAGLINGIIQGLSSGDEGDEDDYFARSLFTRTNNLVLGKLTIPLAHSWRMFFGMGVAMADYIAGRSDETELFVNLSHIVGREMIPDVVNPFQYRVYDPSSRHAKWEFIDMLTGFAPTPFVPIAEIFANRNFMGGTIHDEKPYYPLSPRVARYKRGANPHLVKLTEWWAAKDGYNPELDKDIMWNYDEDRTIKQSRDINASDLEHLITSQLGGTGTFINDMVKLGTKSFNGEDVDNTDIPVLNKLYRPVNEDIAIYRDYKYLKDRAENWEQVLKKNKKDPYQTDISETARELAVSRAEKSEIGAAANGMLEFMDYEEAIKELDAAYRLGVPDEVIKDMRLEIMEMANGIMDRYTRSYDQGKADRREVFEDIRKDRRGIIEDVWDLLVRRGRAGKARATE